jgi:hypothetical protein
MDARLHISLWMIGGGAFGAFLGGVFGGLAAALHAQSGHAAGTGFARRIADAFARTAEQQPSPWAQVIFIGSVDGFVFLGTLGLLAGLLLGKSGLPADELMIPIGVGSVLLALAAACLGAVAYTIRYLTAEFLYGVAFGIAGSILAGMVLPHPYGGAAGCGCGSVIGFALCRIVRRYSPRFRAPEVSKTVPSRHTDANNDITSTTSLPPEEFFRNPDSFEKQ